MVVPKTKIFILILCLSSLIISCSAKKEKQIKLWYNNPAAEWIEALPIGNGRIGAMVFGNPKNERIQLNDDSMWPGGREWENPDGRPEDLTEIRELLFQGKNKLADDLIVKKFSRKGIGRSHQTLGDLFIDFEGHNEILNYRRELDLNNALVNVSYIADGQKINQSVFASYPDQTIIVKYKSEGVNGISAKVRLSRPDDKGIETANTIAKDNQLVMKGEATQRNSYFDDKQIDIIHGVKFETRIVINNIGGSLTAIDDHLKLENVDEFTLYIITNSSFYNTGFVNENIEHISKIMDKDYQTIFNDHVRDYQSLFNRVQLKLTDKNYDAISTDDRLKKIGRGDIDLDLQSTLFQYGRYLLISSSRPGSNPANLQGLWNEHIMAPWNADYHMNINLQMNYWPADVTNLSELNGPLFNFMDRLIERGKITAKQNFGTRGTFFPHATDLWAPTFLRASTAYWGSSFGAAGWMMQHYWEHYRFTNDLDFLQDKVYPALTEAVKFYFDWLIEDPRDGYLIAAPSTSPENQFIMSNGDTVATCLGSAMDQQIIAEVFDNYIETCIILNIENSFLDSIIQKRSKLRPGVIIGSDGRILEWDREYKELEKGHRHMSHIYSFHPGNAITVSQHPELIDAVRKTLEFRLDHGGGGTGWSRAWLINLSARLLEGDKAFEHIQYLFKNSLAKNLFDLHPPFQIDGNFGYTSGVAEMLVQSHEPGIIRLLPALPSAWKNGHITGLKARGNFIIDIEWKNNELLSSKIQAIDGGKTKLLFNDKERNLKLKPGEVFELSP